uniref:Uncharacterized protein n=1 Tax=Anguilla anguilla TaxID=7936 RepID=A0A0E9QS54_ANGAN
MNRTHPRALYSSVGKTIRSSTHEQKADGNLPGQRKIQQPVGQPHSTEGVRKSSQARATELLFQQPVVTIARRHVMSVVNL